eukprot:CAMPEP_0194274686 /NCGR_PEP_ID=MMETSP0169-20130528/7705_1 /TAXON_ID=218684 /ORGANISM="Corethron pennatum, Strain L29A3" /LENGTH=345 /DNA_ID=CAMNT_0039017949 /DNA_START=150 /DNA_END=1183 /DNA_ORIENTATION=-
MSRRAPNGFLAPASTRSMSYDNRGVIVGGSSPLAPLGEVLREAAALIESGAVLPEAREYHPILYAALNGLHAYAADAAAGTLRPGVAQTPKKRGGGERRRSEHTKVPAEGRVPTPRVPVAVELEAPANPFIDRPTETEPGPIPNPRSGPGSSDGTYNHSLPLPQEHKSKYGSSKTPSLTKAFGKAIKAAVREVGSAVKHDKHEDDTDSWREKERKKMNMRAFQEHFVAESSSRSMTGGRSENASMTTAASASASISASSFSSSSPISTEDTHYFPDPVHSSRTSPRPQFDPSASKPSSIVISPTNENAKKGAKAEQKRPAMPMQQKQKDTNAGSSSNINSMPPPP